MDDFAGQIQPPRKFSWWGWIFTISVGGAIVILLLPTLLSRGRGDHGRLGCASNLRQVGLGLMGYQREHGVFPPPYVADATGKPMHSWRTLILPYIDHVELYNRYKFDEPWDGPNNRKLADESISIYRCSICRDKSPGLTDYVLIRGPGTAFPGGGRRVAPRDVRDGEVSTILVVESVDTGIHWAEPRDLEFDRLTFKVNDPGREGMSSYHARGSNALMIDGSIKFLRDDLTPATVRAMLTIDGHETIPDLD